MLRSDQPLDEHSSEQIRSDPLNAFPGIDEACASQDRSVGILFYQAKHGFYFPYHSLHSMEFTANRITLVFASDIVVITGRGLHGLCVGIARQSVWRVVEQGERGSNAPTCIARIQRVPKEEEKSVTP
ncbi:MAG TPA: hypothetical protein PLX89_04880 [Verrucomicrobiota bacterium]|nr:hypothetical protein [Verrucomicrobiota bacterium]